MPGEKKIEYTDDALHQMNSALQDIKESMEKQISDEKFVPGEESISITASDVRNALAKMEIIHRRKTEARKLIVRFYFIVGAIVAFVGIFYQSILDLVTLPRIQLALIATGISMSLVAVLMSYWMKTRWKSIESANEFRYRRTVEELTDKLQQKRFWEREDELLERVLVSQKIIKDFEAEKRRLMELVKEKDKIHRPRAEKEPKKK